MQSSDRGKCASTGLVALVHGTGICVDSNNRSGVRYLEHKERG